MKSDETPGMNDRELIITRILKASPERVFEIWTDPDHTSQWWGPEGFSTTTHSIDLEPGGLWRFTMHGPDGRDYKNLIEFIEVETPLRLVYRHRDDGEVEPVRFHVTITFAPLGKKTLLTMRSTFESAEDLERIEDAYGACEGMHHTLARFTKCLEELDADSVPLRSEND